MAAVSTDVCIEGENFSLVTIPAPSSLLVKNAKKDVLVAVDLATLVADLGKLGNFIRVAYNGVAGNTDLQIKVQRVEYKITKLADKSAVTVHNFKSTSTYVLQKLQGTFQYLLDGLDEMALETLSVLPNVCEPMAKSAEELHNEFEAAITDVIDALEDAHLAKGVQEERQKEFNGKNNEGIKSQLRKEGEEILIKKKKAEALVRHYTEGEKKAQEYYAEAGKREDKALVAVGSDKMVCLEAIAKAHEEKLKHLENMNYQRSYGREAIQQCIEFTERLKNCKDDYILSQVTIDALLNSVDALKSLSAIMMKAAIFWWQMQKHCETPAKKDMIEKAMKYPEEKQVKVWTSKAFKTMAVQSYSKWVALKDVCETYMAQFKETRGDLYASTEENPTIEQSREKFRTFKGDLEKAQRDIKNEASQETAELFG